MHSSSVFILVSTMLWFVLVLLLLLMMMMMLLLLLSFLLLMIRTETSFVRSSPAAVVDADATTSTAEDGSPYSVAAGAASAAAAIARCCATVTTPLGYIDIAGVAAVAAVAEIVRAEVVLVTTVEDVSGVLLALRGIWLGLGQDERGTRWMPRSLALAVAVRPAKPHHIATLRLELTQGHHGRGQGLVEEMKISEVVVHTKAHRQNQVLVAVASPNSRICTEDALNILSEKAVVLAVDLGKLADPDLREEGGGPLASGSNVPLLWADERRDV
mmetsp:Transcript_20132/g.43920  ORF Transcript_20132/g.43920 Transcript_20132/m.43920 type:complete len:272 (-) Transcript_20132:825-1640(-)